MDFTATIIILVALFRGNSAKTNNSYVTNEHALYDRLMNNYKSSIRPVNHENDTLTVEIRVEITYLDDLDERSQTMITSGWVVLTWKDVGLSWDPQEFGGVTEIHIPVTDLWYPDITVANSKDTGPSFPVHHLTLVLPNGQVYWIPPVKLNTHCDLDLSQFPFDEHVCSVVFLSWVYSDVKVNVTSKDVGGEFDLTHYSRLTGEQNEWIVTKMTAVRNEITYSCCPDTYPRIVYELTLKRRSSFVTHLFVAPSVTLAFITPFIFLLPAGTGEKIMLGAGVLVSDVLLLGELINYIPSAHPNLPLIAKFFLGNIVMTALSLAVSALIISQWHASRNRIVGPPAFFRLIILGPVARFFCVRQDPGDDVPMELRSGVTASNVNPVYVEDVASAGGGGLERQKSEQRTRDTTKYLENAARSDWRRVAVVFDRIFFLVYFIILIAMTLAFARYL